MKALSVLFLSLSVANLACAFDDPYDEDVAAITNGWSPAGGPVSWGTGITDADCTFTMIEKRVAVTTRNCAIASREVTVDGVTVRIRQIHNLIDDSRNADPNLALVTLRKPVVLANAPSPFARRFDRNPVQDGEALACYGYSGTHLRAGTFEVTDSSNQAVLSLAGHALILNTALNYEVPKESIGGYCARDGDVHPVAILITDSSTGVASAVRTETFTRGLEAALALDEAVVHGAVRLLDASETDRVTAPLGASLATFEGITSVTATQQAFYREPMAPTGGGSTYVRLVDVASGECITPNGNAVELRPCGSAPQTLFEHVEHIDGWDRYSYIDGSTGSGALDYSAGQTLEFQSWSGADEQRFRMWLAPY